MRARICTYKPETGETTILLFGRQYPLDGIECLIEEYYKYKNTPISTGPYLDSVISGKLQGFIRDVETALNKAKEPIILA
jgi:hypothetical protein